MKLTFFKACILLSLLFLSYMHAQEPILKGYIPIDSLKNRDYKVYIDHFNKTSPEYNIEPDSLFAHEVAMTYLWTAFHKNDTLNMGKAYSMLGQLENLRLDYLNKAILYTKKYGDKYQPAIAYILKSEKFYKNGDYKTAVDLLFEALEYTKRNESFSSYIKHNINLHRSEWGDKKKAKDEFLIHLDELRIQNSNSLRYTETQYSLAQVYYELKEIRNASIYLDSVYQYGIKHNLDKYKLQYYGLKGGILFREGKYKEALQHANQFLELEAPENVYAISRSTVIQGLTLWQLNRKEEAVQAIQKADSLYQISDDEFEELGEGYQLLINYYKEIDDKENQLLYLNKLIEFDRKISSNYIEIGNRIEQEYTLPQLLAEKDEVILKLNQENASEQQNKYIITLLLGLAVVVILYFIRLNSLNKKRFQLLEQQYLASKKSIPKIKEEIILKEKSALDLEEKQIVLISIGLTEFEKTHTYLDNNITLKSLAETLGTNSSYLSKYINSVKETNFNTYISDLRIQYAIYKLQEDTKFRSYTIEAIASEVGFSNTRSFTNHFKRVTGITVSYFIKKLTQKVA